MVVHGGGAWDDVSRVNRLAREGWLGFEDDPATPAAFSLRLWETVGPVVLVALVGVAVAVRRRERRDLVLLSFGPRLTVALRGLASERRLQAAVALVELLLNVQAVSKSPYR